MKAELSNLCVFFDGSCGNSKCNWFFRNHQELMKVSDGITIIGSGAICCSVGGENNNSSLHFSNVDNVFAPISRELFSSLSWFYFFHCCITQQLSSIPFWNIQQIQSQAIIWHQSGITKDHLTVAKCVDDLSPTRDRNHSLFTKYLSFDRFCVSSQKKVWRVKWNEGCFMCWFLFLRIRFVRKG